MRPAPGGEYIAVNTGWEIHHVVPRGLCGSEARSNFTLLHTNCHWQAHSS
ncbi:HNH endonuclease signature motif containing protein [Mesorhizobium sp. M0510]